MNSRNKKTLMGMAVFVLSAAAFVSYYHFLRKPSEVVNGPARLQLTFSAHTAGAQVVEFSPIDETVASGSIDGTAKIWRRDNGRVIRDLKHPSGVTALAYSPDGKFLATASYDSIVRLWRLSDGTIFKSFSGHSQTVWSVAFSPDGQTLASSGEDKTVKLWDVNQGTVRKTLSGHDLNVWWVTFSPDNQRLASGSFDHSIKIWNVQTGQIERTLNAHTQAVLEVDFSDDGQQLVSCGDDSTVRIWDTADWSLRQTLNGSEHVYACAFSPDGKYVLSGGRDRSAFGELLQNFLGPTENNKGVSVRLWDAADGTLVQSFAEHADDVYGVAFSKDGKWFAAAGLDNRVAVWRLP